MSGIVGSHHNIRGSGIVAKLGTDGQIFTSTGAGLSQGFEAAAGGGKVLQVVQVYKQTSFTTASTTFVDVTGLTVDITPSSSDSKILVCGYVTAGCTNWACAKMVRDSTDIVVSTAATGLQDNITWSINSTYAYGVAGYSATLLDDPGTTNAVTYKVQAKVHSATLNFGQSNNNYNNDVTGPSPQTIVCMEIGA